MNKVGLVDLAMLAKIGYLFTEKFFCTLSKSCVKKKKSKHFGMKVHLCVYDFFSLVNVTTVPYL